MAQYLDHCKAENAIDDRVTHYDDRYQDMPDDEFHGLDCACGRRMHASDTECSRCHYAREFPDA